MTTSTKKNKEARLSEVSSLLSQLSDKDLSMVEAMVKARQPQDSFDVLLDSLDGKELTSNLKALKATKIYFELGKLKSLDKEVSISWQIDDVQYYPQLSEPGSNRRMRAWNGSTIAQEVVNILQDMTDDCGESLGELLPTKARQELDKDRGRVKAALAALESKTTSFSLKDLPDLNQGAVCISFETLEHDGVGSIFIPEISWKSKKKRDSIFESLLDFVVEDLETLENDLPEEAATKLRDAWALGGKIMKGVETLTKKSSGWDADSLLSEAISSL